MTAKKKPAARKPAARKPAARKPAARKPAARRDPLAGVYVDGLAVAEHVPLARPSLTSGSADPTVLEIVELLNKGGADLPLDPHVTPELLDAVEAFRAAHGIPPEQGYDGQPRQWIGPNLWAAVKALS